VLISTIIPTRNRAKHLKRVLDFLLADPYPQKEIIVCDGASTDGTVELLKQYGDRVRWVSRRDGGEYEARNTGLRMVTGEIIKYMSDDDVPLPGTFDYAAAFFRDHPEVDILFGQSIWFDERGGLDAMVCDNRKRTQESITLRNFLRFSRPSPNSETAFFRRRVIDRIGLFDTSQHGADYEYWVRAAKAGLDMRISDRVFLHYHISDLSGVERKSLKLLLEGWRRAWRYGTWADRLYFTLYRVPLRLTVRSISRVPKLGPALRTAWGKRKARSYSEA